MIGHRKVSVIMAAGRRRYMPIITKYILEEPIVDEWQIWVNTQVPEDIEYLHKLGAEINASRPGFVRLIECPNENWGEVGSMGAIRAFYTPETIDKGTIYLRVDDDIVHVHDRALRTLAQFRSDNPQYFLVTGNMVNSGLCSHLQHRMGCHQEVIPAMLAPRWSSEGGDLHWSSNMATVIHDSYLKAAEDGRLDGWRQYERWELYETPRFGIAFCSFFGRDMLEIISKWRGEDDEIFMTEDWPRQAGRINCIAGKALVAHYAYGPQRKDGFEERSDLVTIQGEKVYSKDILNRYRKLAGIQPSD